MDAREEIYDSDPAMPGVGGLRDKLLGVRSDGLLALTVSVTLENGGRIVRTPSRMSLAHGLDQAFCISTLEVQTLLEGSPEAAPELGAIGEDEYWDLVETGFEDW